MSELTKANATRKPPVSKPIQAKPVIQTLGRNQNVPGSMSYADVMQLQSTIGNQAVMQLLRNVSVTPPVQRQETEEHEEPVQGKANEDETVQKKPNNTGLPDQLKVGVENLSGLSMDNVKVHYNSDKPKGLGALAYTQGTDIHVAPGQERYLPHEAWHVVQQMQGRVRPTFQMKGLGVGVNDDAGLEREADGMGERGLSMGSAPVQVTAGEGPLQQRKTGSTLICNRTAVKLSPLQCATVMSDHDELKRVKKDSYTKAESKKEKEKQQRLTRISQKVIWEIIKKGFDPGPEIQCSKVGGALYVAINSAYPAPRVEDKTNPRHAVSQRPLSAQPNSDAILENAVIEVLQQLKLGNWVKRIVPIAQSTAARNQLRTTTGGKQHAESRIINELLRSYDGKRDLATHRSKAHIHADMGRRVLRIGGTKPPCDYCEDAFEGTEKHLTKGTSYRDLISRYNLSLISVIPEGVQQDTDKQPNWEDAMHKRIVDPN